MQPRSVEERSYECACISFYSEMIHFCKYLNILFAVLFIDNLFLFIINN